MPKVPLASKHFATVDQCAAMCAKAVEMADTNAAKGRHEMAVAFEARLREATTPWYVRAYRRWMDRDSTLAQHAQNAADDTSRNLQRIGA